MDIDDHPFAAALHRLGDDKELFQDLIAYFREDAPKLLAAMRAGIASGHRDGVVLAAHRLRGLLANFDAQAAMHIAAEIERTAPRVDPQTATHRIADLALEIQCLFATLDAYAADLAAPTCKLP